MDAEAKKKAAALEACKSVRSGMVLGLGTGSTVRYALEELARLHQAGTRLVGVPTSRATEEAARRLGIPVSTLDEHPKLDLTIDGADEIDPQLRLIKGGGGALLREKVVAAASRSVLIVADESKFVSMLGTTFPVPVEVAPFARAVVTKRLQDLGSRPVRREAGGKAYVTDNGNEILDARFPSLPDPAVLEREIKMTPGVAEVGLFVGLATRALLGSDSGVRHVEARTETTKPATKPF